MQGSPSCLSALTGEVPFYHGGPGAGLILVWELDSVELFPNTLQVELVFFFYNVFV